MNDPNKEPDGSARQPASSVVPEKRTQDPPGLSDLPPLLSGLDDLPEEAKMTVQSMISFAMRSGGPPPEFLAKITPEHISETIRQAGRNSELEFRDVNRARWVGLAQYGIGAIAVVYLAITLGPTSPGVLEKIFTWLVIAAGGVGIGIGRMSLRRKQ